MTAPRSKAPFLYWWPERGETAEDAREFEDRPTRMPEWVAHDIAELDWHRNSPDYFEDDQLCLVSPDGQKHTYAIHVEQVPSFSVREQ